MLAAVLGAPHAERGAGRRVDPRLLYLALWIVLPVVLFSLSHSKRPQYILPLLPADVDTLTRYGSAPGLVHSSDRARRMRLQFQLQKFEKSFGVQHGQRQVQCPRIDPFATEARRRGGLTIED